MIHRAVIVACARDETANIAEWLSYHRALGFAHVYLYCNDDDPAALHGAVLPFLGGPAPLVTFHHYAAQGEQFRMYLHALAHYRAAAEWIAFLDIDEFLALRGGQTLDGLLDAIPPDQGCLLLHWLMFGPNGHETPPAGSVIAAYTRRAAGVSVSTKTLTRARAIDLGRITRRLMFWHNWEDALIPGARSRGIGGLVPAAMAAAGPFLADPAVADRILAEAAIHHYAFRSRAAPAQRVARGLEADFAGQAMWEDPAGAAEAMAQCDAVEDRFLVADWAARRARLRAGSAVLPGPAFPPLARWTTEGDGPVWTLDLGTPARIGAVRVFARLLAGRIAWRIETSSDGRHWLLLAHPEVPPAGTIPTEPVCLTPPAPLPARLVRISLTRPDAVPPERIEAYGLPG